MSKKTLLKVCELNNGKIVVGRPYEARLGRFYLKEACMIDSKRIPEEVRRYSSEYNNRLLEAYEKTPKCDLSVKLSRFKHPPYTIIK